MEKIIEGPFKSIPGQPEGSFFILDRSNAVVGMVFKGRPRDYAEFQDVARLLAASWELLAAARKSRDFLAGIKARPGVIDGCIEMLEHAIKKAEPLP
jgi:hypothetical protein